MAVAGTSWSMGQMVGELNATGVARRWSECGQNKLSQMILPHIESFGMFGSVLAILVVAVALIGFRVIRSEEARYRLVTGINVLIWPIILLGVATFFLAVYALPHARCAAFA